MCRFVLFVRSCGVWGGVQVCHAGPQLCVSSHFYTGHTPGAHVSWTVSTNVFSFFPDTDQREVFSQILFILLKDLIMNNGTSRNLSNSVIPNNQ